ncbi:MAG: Na+/H+ antiporter subunit E [Bacillota bacterium]
MTMKTVDKAQKNSSNPMQFIMLTAILFAFWVLLSGKMEAKFLIIGFGTSLVSAWVSMSILQIPSMNGKGSYFAFQFPFARYFTYWLWLIWQIVLANIDVVKVVLSPKMPINPKMVFFKMPLDNPISHVTLANSITLTPGTITVDIEDGVYAVHALTDGAADGLLEGEMQRRVARLFSEQVEVTAQRGEG